MKNKQTVKVLLMWLTSYPLIIPLIVLSGSIAALCEGLGLTLLVPLIQTTGLSNQSGYKPTFAFIDQLFGNLSNDEKLIYIPLCILASIFTKNIVTYFNGALFSVFNWKINYQIRSEMYAQILAVGIEFIERNRIGHFLNILDKETWQTSQALKSCVSLVVHTCTILVFTIILSIISLKLALITVCLTVVISLSMQAIKRQIKRLSQQAASANSQFVAQALEGISGVRVIHAFSNESYEQERFNQASVQVCNSFRRLDLLTTAFLPITESLSSILVIVMTVVALRTQYNLPTLLTFLFMLYRLQPHVRRFDSARLSLFSVLGSVDQVIGLLNRNNKPYIHSGSKPFIHLQSGIHLDAVTFHYSGSPKTSLSQVSLFIPAGKVTAIVGPSGAGKSTLIDLICRYYDVISGGIYVDDVPIQELNLADWRRHIALVSQDTYLFSSTIYDNIAYGNLEASEAEVITAAKQAHAHEFILSFPQGYQTEIGDRGVRLSGGQRQRLALARAILRNPEMLILDEATNALDSISESLIQETLSVFTKTRTTLVVAHRLSTIENADQIIVMNDGQCVEQGSFQFLLSLKGLFYDLYQRQTFNTIAEEK